METLWQDLRFGIRMLRMSPGFTAVAVLSLALGIGANSAIFSVLNATLLRLRPYPKDPDRAFMMILLDMKNGDLGGPQTLINYLYWRDHNQVFEHLAAGKPGSFIFTGGEKPERITGQYVSANFFSSIGVQAVLGRTFYPKRISLGVSTSASCLMASGSTASALTQTL